MTEGIDTLNWGLNFLTALHSQIVNVPDVRQQEMGRFGVMVPRWAAAPGTSEEDAKELLIAVIRKRAIQSVPVMNAIKLVQELIREHQKAQLFPASEVEGT